jgi:hypothetical protein
MFQEVVHESRSKSFPLVVRMDHDIPYGSPENKVCEKPAKSHHFPFLANGKAHRGPFEHPFYLLE